jgi:uncharacterized damage-inducible protein DinB
MPLSQALIADFQKECANTRKLLDAVPEGRFDWKPHEKSMSLGRLAGHIAELPSLAPAIMQREFDFAAAGSTYKPFTATSRADLLRVFEQHVNGFDKVVADKDDEFLSATWTLRVGEKVLMSLPRHAAIRTLAIHHVIHHRGQLTVYFRLLGVPVPPTYGPTADNPGF